VTDPVNEAAARLRAETADMRNHGCTITAVCAACDLRAVLDALEVERKLADGLAGALWDQADDGDWLEKTRSALAAYEKARNA
jgi:hypothetical protein